MQKTKIPFVFLSDGDGTVYHSNADKYERLNTDKITQISHLLVKLTSSAQQRTKGYTYNHPFGAYGLTPKFVDAKNLEHVAAKAAKCLKQNSKIRRELRINLAVLRKIIAAGENNFGPSAMKTLVVAAMNLTKLSREHFVENASK